MRVRLTLLSLLSVGLYALLAVRGVADTDVEFWGIWVSLFAAYLVAVRVAAPRSERAVFAIIFVTSVLCRGALFLGSALQNGSPEVFLYGASPLTALAASLEVGPMIERIVAVAFDLAALALAPGLLKAARLPIGAAVIHGWNPLVITETAGSGRLEVVALALVVLSLRLVQKRAYWPAAIAYGVSLSAPLVLVATLPLAARALRARLVLALGLALYGWNQTFPWTSWVERAEWPPETALGGSLAPAAVALAKLFVTRNEAIPFAVLFASWAGFAIVHAVRARQPARLPLEALLAVGGLVFVSPQVLPWAFVAFAYLAAHSHNRGWIAFTATAPVIYLATGETWSFWLGFAQYFVPYALLIFFWLGRPPSPRLRRTSPPRGAAGE